MTKAETMALAPGTRVFCTVRTRHGYIGWCTLVDVRPRDGYIKIANFGSWCPPFNFSLEEP